MKPLLPRTWLWHISQRGWFFHTSIMAVELIQASGVGGRGVNDDLVSRSGEYVAQKGQLVMFGPML